MFLGKVWHEKSKHAKKAKEANIVEATKDVGDSLSVRQVLIIK